MQFTLLKSLAIALASVGFASANYDANSQDNVVMYWGQASAGHQDSLGDYCQKTAGDIYVVSFINRFGGSTEKPQLGIAGCENDQCKLDIGQDIKKCQDSGKTILLSLGGAIGNYGLNDDAQGKQLADDLWNMFGGGSSEDRPFGEDIQVDGFDLDMENKDQTGYPAMVKQLRSHFDGASKKYYVSAAPQCVFPDASVGDALDQTDIDMAFVQFFNNPCNVGKEEYNWNTWSNYAKTKSHNKNIKLFLGVPGGPTAAGSGYISPNLLQQAVKDIGSDSSFAGVMMWDASQAYSNLLNGNSTTYADQVKKILTSKATIPLGPGYNSTTSLLPSPTGGSGSGSSGSGSSGSGSSGSGSSGSGSSGSGSSGSGSSGSGSSSSGSSGSGSGSGVGTGSNGPGSGGSSISQRVKTNTVPSDCQSKQGGALSNCLNDHFYAKDSPAAPAIGESCSVEDQTECRKGKFVSCKQGQWVVLSCPTGTHCYANLREDDVFVGCNATPDRCTAPAMKKRHGHFVGNSPLEVRV